MYVVLLAIVRVGSNVKRLCITKTGAEVVSEGEMSLPRSTIWWVDG